MSFKRIEKFVEDISSQLKQHETIGKSNLKKWKIDEETKDLYAIVAPLESYKDLSQSRMIDHFWNCIDVGDVVIGKVISKTERGLSICLLCFDAGKSQAIESLEIIARCPRSEMPKTNNHEDPLLRFSINDLVRAEITSIYHKEERLILSLYCKYSSYEDLQYGVITEENLPVAYKRMCTNIESYDKLLHLSTGFYNPNVVEYLCERILCLNNSCNSFVNDLENLRYSTNELASALRKRQSAKVAKRSVSKGINFYRKGQMLEALQELNYALELDNNNIDALVARGALYANKRTFAKAISDFELAINFDPHNKNAKRYLIEVLIERAKSIEVDAQDLAQIKEASNLYKRALSLDHDCIEAKNALGLLEKSEKEKRSSTDSASSDDVDLSKTEQSEKTATIVKVRQLLEKDVGKSDRKTNTSQLLRKNSQNSRKKSISTSSDSTSSSSSTSSSDSSTDSSPAPKKRRTSSSSHKFQNESNYDKSLSHKSKKRSYSSSSSDSSASSKKTKRRKMSSSSSKQAPTYVAKSEVTSRRKSSEYSYNKYSTHTKAKHSSNTKAYISKGKEQNSFEQKHKNSSRNRRDFISVKAHSSSRNIAYNKHDRQSRSPMKWSQASVHTSNVNVPQSKSTHQKNINEVGKTLMKVTKDNFNNILDQISKFEVKRKSM